MHPTGITANLSVADLAEAREFYVDFLGLTTEGFNLGDDVEAAYEEAQRRGLEIVHPLTQEPWGVRRFFVRAPDGNVINIVSHKD
jgi:catechol 2,3-dioxygenase-like lactoylglutathione lyase family enzyme